MEEVNEEKSLTAAVKMLIDNGYIAEHDAENVFSDLRRTFRGTWIKPKKLKSEIFGNPFSRSKRKALLDKYIEYVKSGPRSPQDLSMWKIDHGICHDEIYHWADAILGVGQLDTIVREYQIHMWIERHVRDNPGKTLVEITTALNLRYDSVRLIVKKKVSEGIFRVERTTKKITGVYYADQQGTV